MKENADIRLMIIGRKYQYKEIAQHIGITDVHLSHLLRYKLSDKNRDRILNAVYEMDQKKERNTNDNDRYRETVAKANLSKLLKGKREEMH